MTASGKKLATRRTPHEGEPATPAERPLMRGYLPHLLSRLLNLLNLELLQHLRPLDLTVQQFRVMQVLIRQDGSTINEIARDTVLEQSVVSRLVGQLERRKLAVRRKNEHNARFVQVFLTERGRATIDALQPAAKAIIANALSDLATTERELLMQLLQRVFERVNTPQRALLRPPPLQVPRF